MRGGVEISECDCEALWEVVRSIEMDVLGLPLGPAARESSVVGRRLGESGWRTELKLMRARDLRGELLRRGNELFESKLPWDMPCLQVMMRSFGGCVDMLLLREWLVRDRMLLGRPSLEPALRKEPVSHASLMRTRLLYAQSCLNTLIAPV